MTSYNRLNQTYASENSAALTGWLRDELAFPGFVVSDWGGQHSGAESAAAGLDMAMPNSNGYWEGNLASFIANCSLTQARFDDMVARTLTAWYKIIGGPNASFPEAAIGMPSDLTAPHPLIDAGDPESKPTLLQGAIESHVLVKNTNNALPLQRPILLSLFGFDATIPRYFNPTSPFALDFDYTYSMESTNVTLLQAAQLLGTGDTTGAPTVSPNGEMWTGFGSGANVPSALSDVSTLSAV
jgi:beta-glucosidase